MFGIKIDYPRLITEQNILFTMMHLTQSAEILFTQTTGIISGFSWKRKCSASHWFKGNLQVVAQITDVPGLVQSIEIEIDLLAWNKMMCWKLHTIWSKNMSEDHLTRWSWVSTSRPQTQLLESSCLKMKLRFWVLVRAFNQLTRDNQRAREELVIPSHHLPRTFTSLVARNHCPLDCKTSVNWKETYRAFLSANRPNGEPARVKSEGSITE